MRQSKQGQRARGSAHGRAVLTEEQARAIKYDYPHLTHMEVARRYPQCGHQNIFKIRKGYSWRHL